MMETKIAYVDSGYDGFKIIVIDAESRKAWVKSIRDIVCAAEAIPGICRIHGVTKVFVDINSIGSALYSLLPQNELKNIDVVPLSCGAMAI